MRQDRGEDQVLRNPSEKKDNDSDSDIEMMGARVRGVNNKEENVEYRKAQIQKLNQVLAAKRLKPLIRPSVIFSSKDIHPLQAL